MTYYSNLSGSVSSTKSKPKNLMGGYGDSVVDKSKFRPTLVNNGSGQRVVGSARSGLYDFEDGVDTGFRLGVLRSPSPDITEVDSVKNILENTINSKVSKAKQEFSDTMDKIVQENQKQIKEVQANGNE